MPGPGTDFGHYRDDTGPRKTRHNDAVIGGLHEGHDEHPHRPYDADEYIEILRGVEQNAKAHGGQKSEQKEKCRRVNLRPIDQIPPARQRPKLEYDAHSPGDSGRGEERLDKTGYTREHIPGKQIARGIRDSHPRKEDGYPADDDGKGV